MEDFVGFGSLGEAFLSLEGGNYRRIFVIASENGWKRFNAPENRNFFTEREMELFSAFSVNPDFSEILAGADRCRAFKPDLLVALGGGSPIDVAKVVKAEVFTKEPYDPAQPSTIKPSGDGPPLVAIPTTAGSGAEATHFAVFYLGEEKQSLSHPSLRPDMAIVDPEMSYSLPPPQTACTGIDAIAQAVEGHWASSTSPEARELASAAIRYALPNLHAAVHHPGPASRYNMAQAAYLAGKTLDLTRSTMPHALGYHLTKRYGLPHGHAVALTLPYFFLLNVDPASEVTTPLGAEGHRANMKAIFALFGQSDAAGAFRFWRELARSCGLTVDFAEVGLTERRQFEDLVATANPERMKNHPVRIEPARLVDFFMTYR